MTLRTLAVCLVGFALVTPVLAGDLPVDLARKDAAARRKVGDELHRLARFCIQARAYSCAREELELGLELAPATSKLERELRRIEGREDAQRDDIASRLELRRQEAHERCAGWLTEVARYCEARGHTEFTGIYVDLVVSHFESDDNRRHLGMVFFEPYRKWVSARDLEKLQSGWEQVGGEWVSPDEVKVQDAAHRTWDDPWVISDDVHELRTTAPLRTARRILGHITAFREFFLARFADEWDLRQPTGKLPVVLSETQEDQRRQLQRIAGESDSILRGAACYLQTNTALNPCFVTFQPLTVDGELMNLGVDDVLLAVQHEVSHQLAFEYSKYDYDRTRPINSGFWCVEALASYMEYFVLEGDQWRLSRPRIIPVEGGYMEGAFAQCKTNLRSLPALREFFALSREEFPTMRNYHMAATVSWFLLEGEGGRHRSSYLDLLEVVHKVHDTEDSFARCFPGVDVDVLQSQWEEFVRAIELDD